MDAFDSDVLIYAAVPDHPLGRRVAGLFTGPTAGTGSVLLLPEVLSRPIRDGDTGEITALTGLLTRLDLQPVDRRTAQLAVSVAATYRLRAADAVHLATAVLAGADRFITDNRKDFPESITEIAITYPGLLDDPAEE